MLNTAKFTVFATELLKDYSLEVSTNDGALICNTETGGDASKITQAVFAHERVNVGVSHKNSDWALGGMEIVKDMDTESGALVVYIENHSKQLRPIALMAEKIERGRL